MTQSPWVMSFGGLAMKAGTQSQVSSVTGRCDLRQLLHTVMLPVGSRYQSSTPRQVASWCSPITRNGLMHNSPPPAGNGRTCMDYRRNSEALEHSYSCCQE